MRFGYRPRVFFFFELPTAWYVADEDFFLRARRPFWWSFGVGYA